MNTSATAFFTQVMTNIAVQAPLLLVCLAGLVVVAMKWRQHPRASLLAGLGLLLRVVVGIGAPVVSGLLSHVFREQLGPRVGTAFTVAGVAWSLIGAVSVALLLAAVYVSRQTSSQPGLPAGAPPIPAR